MDDEPTWETILRAIWAFGSFFLVFIVLPATMFYLGKGLAHAAQLAWRDLRRPPN